MNLYEDCAQRERARLAGKKALRKYERKTGVQLNPEQKRDWLNRFIRKVSR